MELYQAYTRLPRYDGSDRESVPLCCQEVLGTTQIVYNGVEIDLGKPFERITMVDAVKKYAGVDFNEIHTWKKQEQWQRNIM